MKKVIHVYRSELNYSFSSYERDNSIIFHLYNILLLLKYLIKYPALVFLCVRLKPEKPRDIDAGGGAWGSRSRCHGQAGSGGEGGRPTCRLIQDWLQDCGTGPAPCH
jgi:hypothetical protein